MENGVKHGVSISERLSVASSPEPEPHRNVLLRWTTAGIQTKILVPLTLMMIIFLLGNTAGFIISTNATRNTIFARQFDEDLQRVVTALTEHEQDVLKSAGGLSADPELLKTLLDEQMYPSRDTTHTMSERAKLIRDNFQMDQIMVLNAEREERINLAIIPYLSPLITYIPETMTCEDAPEMRLFDVVLRETEVMHVLVGCAPVVMTEDVTISYKDELSVSEGEVVGFVYTVLDVEETLLRIHRELRLSSELRMTRRARADVGDAFPDTHSMNSDEAISFSHDGHRFHSVPIALGGDTIHVTLIVSEQDINEIVFAGFRVTLIASLLMLLVLLVAGYMLAGSFTRPIMHLADIAQGVAAGNLSRRAHFTHSDEIGQLGRSLDHATDTITNLLEQQTRLLDKQERMSAELQAILNSMGDGVLAVDVEERIVMVNPSAASLLGQEAGALIGQQLECITNGDDPVLVVGLQYIVEQVRLELFNPKLATIEERVSLGSRIVRIQVAPTMTVDNTLTGSVLLLQDITGLVEVEHAKSEFLATASHELRTPLSGLKGFVDIFVLSGIDNLTETQSMFLDSIRRQTNQMVQMVNDLLEVARLEQGSIRIERRWVAPGTVIDEALNTLQPLIEKRQVAISVDQEPELPSVWVDILHMRRVMTNIISNAVKYVYEGGQVEIRAYTVDDPSRLPSAVDGQPWLHREPRSVVVEIKDNGVGIREIDQPYIFNRFFRSENPLSVEVGGSGLGLAIARELVCTNHGQIGFCSIEGDGSRFWVRLPAPSTEPLLHENGSG